MAGLNFSANLSFLFTEYKTYAERFEAAAAAGFKGVEINFPYTEPVEDIVDGATLDIVLINTFPGEGGQLGFAAIPGKENEFAESVRRAFVYVDALRVPRLHIMSGVANGEDRAECYKTLESNLRSILPDLEKRNVVGVIEPINNQTVPGYFLNNYSEALELVNKIGSPFLQLQIDIFHLQQIQGSVTKFLRDAIPVTGHIQIAQVPHRHEPLSKGELDYDYIFCLLRDELNYKNWIGLEYHPEKGTAAGLGWVSKYSSKI
jgi:hydroxypyruvate isomerase